MTRGPRRTFLVEPAFTCGRGRGGLESGAAGGAIAPRSRPGNAAAETGGYSSFHRTREMSPFAFPCPRSSTIR